VTRHQQVQYTPGGWQSDADYEDRRRTFQRILQMLFARKPNARPEWMRKLPHMASLLEESLYKQAPSHAEYLDELTLKGRLQGLALSMGTKTATWDPAAAAQAAAQQQRQQQQQAAVSTAASATAVTAAAAAASTGASSAGGSRSSTPSITATAANAATTNSSSSSVSPVRPQLQVDTTTSAAAAADSAVQVQVGAVSGASVVVPPKSGLSPTAQAGYNMGRWGSAAGAASTSASATTATAAAGATAIGSIGQYQLPLVSCPFQQPVPCI
jgi:KIX domain